MKKILSVLLVLVLAVGTTFAGVTLSGSASTEFGYVIKNADKDNWLGFTNATSVEAAIDAVTSETINEGDVYAGIKASLSFVAFDGSQEDVLTVDSFGIDEAYIAGENWKVSILSAAGVPTFATGWEANPDDEDDVADMMYSYLGQMPSTLYGKTYDGITVTVYDWVVGVGASIDFDKGEGKAAFGSLKTPEFVLTDGMTLQVGGGVTKITLPLVEVSGGLIYKYVTDTLSLSAATDIMVMIPTEEGSKAEVEADAALSVSYAPVTADFYYATNAALPSQVVESPLGKSAATYIATYTDRGFSAVGSEIPPTEEGGEPTYYIGIENYLSTKVTVDLAAFDIPVALTFAGLDLVNTQYLDFEVKSNIDALTVTGFGGYQVEYEKWHAGAEVAYDFGQVGVLSAGTTFVGTSNALTNATVKVGLENTTLVNGATLKVGYESGNLKAEEWGKIFASAKIEF